MVGTRRHETVQRHGSRVDRQNLLCLSKERSVRGGLDRGSANLRQEQEDNVGHRFEESSELYDLVVEIENVRQRNHKNDPLHGSAEYSAHRHGRTIVEIYSILGGGCSLGHASERASKQG